MTNVVQLAARRGSSSAPLLGDLVQRVHRLSLDSANIGFMSPHLQERMKQRGKTMRDVLEVLNKGEGIQGPNLDQYGDWRIKMRRCVCGKRTQLIVAVRDNDITVITIF